MGDGEPVLWVRHASLPARLLRGRCPAAREPPTARAPVGTMRPARSRTHVGASASRVGAGPQVETCPVSAWPADLPDLSAAGRRAGCRADPGDGARAPWQRLPQDQRGAIVAHTARRETDAVICRLRFRMPRGRTGRLTGAPAHPPDGAPSAFRQSRGPRRKGGVNDRPDPATAALSSNRPFQPNLTPGVRDGRSGLRRDHDRGLRAGGPCRQGGDEAVTAENIVGLVVAVSLLCYLILALIFPERF